MFSLLKSLSVCLPNRHSHRLPPVQQAHCRRMTAEFSSACSANRLFKKNGLHGKRTPWAIPHKDCATDASSNFSSDETKSGENFGEIGREICKQMACKVARRSLCGIAPDSRWCKGSTVQGQRCPRFHTMPAQTAFSQVRRNIFQNKKRIAFLRSLRRTSDSPPRTFSGCPRKATFFAVWFFWVSQELEKL